MWRRFLTYAYLLLYALSVIWMVALILRRADLSGYFNKAVLTLGVFASVLLLLSNLGFFLARKRSSSVVWGAMSIWSMFLTWFSWFSDGSPFIQHEFHYSDLNQLAAESHRFKCYAILSFFILLFWFWSYLLLWRHRLSATDGGLPRST